MRLHDKLARKLLALGCTATLVLGLSACGGSGSSQSVINSLPDLSDIPPVSSSSRPAASGSTDQSDSASTPSNSFTLTIPEGYTLARIGMTLEEKGICTDAEFIEACQTGDFSEYPLVAAIPANANRCFLLEGYLFPDTYEFLNDVTADTVIRTMLSNAERRIDSALRERATALGMSIDQVISLASIIQKESFGTEAMANVSSALHNRLAINMKLQCDVTINYVEGAIKPFISGDINRYNEYYNTYKCAALPAGAICNPGLDAISAALYPATTNYIYFLTDADGNYYYGATWEEHEANIKKAGI